MSKKSVQNKGKKSGRRRRSRADVTSRQNKTAMLAITMVVCLLCLVMLYQRGELEQRLQENSLREQELNEQIQSENERTKEIQELEEYMQTEEYIAGVAQNKLGLVKENEILFKPEK